jgi:hypothetical protein
MGNLARSGFRPLGSAGLVAALLLVGCRAPAQEPDGAEQGTTPAFVVDGEIALRTLMALGDAHLRKMADMLQVLAGTDAARSADWDRVRAPLAEVAERNVPAVNWFALPDGSYWSIQEGRAPGNLSDRAYWPRVMAGETVIGDLVVSRATGRNVAIVAVPVLGRDNGVVGALGASVHLDSLSARIGQEMGLGPNHLFYSLDTEPLVGLHVDPQTIFLHPLEEGDPDVERAMREILSRDEGVVSYPFRGTQRTVLFRRSPVTGWWYAFGVLEP